jgi:outer membrane protein
MKTNNYLINMKLISKIFIVLLLFVSGNAVAQAPKFGHINLQDLINVMPERDSALVKLEKFGNDLQETLTTWQNEYQTKLNTYQQKSATWTAAILEAKQKELVDLQNNYEQYQQRANSDFQQTQQQLFAPVYKKANEVIAKIGKANNLVYIFDTTSGSIPYIDSALSTDVLPLAKAEMKIPADKKPMQLKPAAEAGALAK